MKTIRSMKNKTKKNHNKNNNRISSTNQSPLKKPTSKKIKINLHNLKKLMNPTKPKSIKIIKD